MFRRLIITILSVVAVSLFSASAQSAYDRMRDSILSSRKFIPLETSRDSADRQRTDSIALVIERFYADQFHHFQDPEAPYFMFVSRDSKLSMGIGGAVRMRGYYEWGGVIPASAFIPYLIPMTPDPAQMRKFDTTPAGTCLFFKVIGQNKTLGNYMLYIETNFSGYESRDLKLKKAYAVINDFTIGYANSTFSDPSALPPVIDAHGAANKITPTSVLVRWMPRVKKHWVFALSAETPSTQVDADGTNTKTVTNSMPDFAAFAQYEWGPTSHLRLSGIVRRLAYRNLIEERNHARAGWGVQLSGTGHPADPLTLYGSVCYGHGYAGLGSELMMGNYDLVADPARPGYLYAPASYGWCLGVQYNIRPNLFVSAALSQNRYLPACSVASDEFKYGMSGDVNIFWYLTPRIQAAAEFNIGNRCNFSGHTRYARRVGLMCQFSF